MSSPTYTGHVDAKGAPSTRDLPDVTITKLSVGPMDNNAYLLVCKHTGEGVLIDAANDADRILTLVAAGSAPVPVRSIITTHRHWDHHVALPDVARATGAQNAAGRDDADELPVAVDRPLDDGDTVPLGDCTLEIIALRGHTPGSVAVLYRDPQGHGHLFTGDSLFPGGPGKTNSPADFGSLMDDLEARVFGVLPDDTWVYPGHGDDTTLGRERASVPQWRARGW
ncbi:MBL fold metallo-hydrolase [Nakamurella sp.]|uniref:MBL fold metallo-hydrolase n=1 Tax=Nakamurella sp. TaxID=1869182 RepID=UPI003784D313